MNNQIFAAARRFVSPVLLVIVIAIAALVVTFSSAGSIAYAGDAAGGNAVVRLATPTPHH